MFSPIKISESFEEIDTLQLYLGKDTATFTKVGNHYNIKTEKQVIDLYVGDVVQVVDNTIIICFRGH